MKRFIAAVLAAGTMATVGCQFPQVSQKIPKTV